MMSITKEIQSKSSDPYNYKLSESIDKETANILYNYGKSELKKDITVFGKHHLLSEDGFGTNDDKVQTPNNKFGVKKFW